MMNDLELIVEWISQRRSVTFLIGAGASTSVGIPDFRSPGTGLYANLEKLNLPYSEAVFDIDYFRKNPEAFYTLAASLYPGKFFPSRFHFFMRLLQDKKQLKRVYTQNIDTLERIAGVHDHLIVEAHGSFARNHCIDCGKEMSVQDFKRELGIKEAHLEGDAEPKPKRSEEEASDPKSESKSEPKSESISEPKSESISEPKSAPKSESKPESKPAPKYEPKYEPKSEPAPEQEPEPKSEPAPEPESEPKPTPKTPSSDDVTNNLLKLAKSGIPTCSCGGYVKPDIVFFGEGLPTRFYDLWEKDRRDVEVAIIAGTSLTVHPFASLPEDLGRNSLRVLANKEYVGNFTRLSDVVYLATCDDFADELCRRLGWKTELDDLIERERRIFEGDIVGRMEQMKI